MSDKEKIKEEIKRLKQTNGYLPVDNHEICDAYRARGYQFACDDILQFIDSLPEEPASKDLEEEIKRYINEEVIVTNENIVISKHHEFHNFYVENLVDIARHFAEWQKQQDEELFKDDSWNYIEELYPNTSQEEKLRLYDISIKSRLAGANTIKQHMKEALQTEYEKGRFDMREKMMKALIGGEVVKDMHNQLSVKSEPLNNTFGDIKFGEKVKIIIIKPEQQ